MYFINVNLLDLREEKLINSQEPVVTLPNKPKLQLFKQKKISPLYCIQKNPMVLYALFNKVIHIFYYDL
jgi:hypothetical protein